jgi:hypothetical protein
VRENITMWARGVLAISTPKTYPVLSPLMMPMCYQYMHMETPPNSRKKFQIHIQRSAQENNTNQLLLTMFVEDCTRRDAEPQTNNVRPDRTDI